MDESFIDGPSLNLELANKVNLEIVDHVLDIDLQAIKFFGQLLIDISFHNLFIYLFFIHIDVNFQIIIKVGKGPCVETKLMF